MASPSLPDSSLNPVEYIRQFAADRKFDEPKPLITQINLSPVIFECRLELAGTVETGLGKTETEAIRTAYLCLYELICSGKFVPTVSEAAQFVPDPTKPWFERPKNYLSQQGLKFKRPITYEEEKTSNGFSAKAIMNADAGLVGFGKGPTKKEASIKAALHLCHLLDEYIASNGPPFKRIPEYAHFLTRDLADREKFSWYNTPKNEAVRIASALTLPPPVYDVQPAPLDPDTFLCTLMVSKERNVIGYGRGATTKEASRLAAIDLSARFCHLTVKSKEPSREGSPMKDVSVLPSTAAAVEEPISTATLEMPSPSLAINYPSNPHSEPVDPISIVNTPVIKIELPATKTISGAISEFSQASRSESPATVVDNLEGPPLKGKMVNEDFVKMCNKFLTNSPAVRQLNSWKKQYRLGKTDCKTYMEPRPRTTEWICVISTSGPKNLLVSARSSRVFNSKKLAFLDSFIRFLERLNSQIEACYLKPAESSKKSRNRIEVAAQNLIEDSVNINALEPLSKSRRLTENAKTLVGPLQTIACVPNKPFLMLSFPQMTIQSLIKWFDNTKNFGRMVALSRSLEASPLQAKLPSPLVHVSIAMLERKSRDLLDDLNRFQTSARGQEILSYRASLPIFSYREEIINLINGNQVVLVSGENGYGKSTQVPNFIIEQMTLDKVGAQCNIIVITSTLLAAKTLASCLAEERGEELNVRISCAENEFNDAQRFGSVTFCTGEIFLEHLEKSSELYGFSHVVIDNIEDGSLINELLLLAMGRLLDKRPELRLVMLSSLVDLTAYSQYFSMRSFNALVMVPFDINIQQYFIEDYFGLLDKALVSSKDSSDFVKEELALSDRANRGEAVTVDEPTEFMPYSLIEAILGKLCRSTDPSESILVFLPSGEEISTLHRFLTEDDILKVGYSNEQAFRFIFIHSHVRNLDDVYRVDYRAALPVRKIFLCTSEAESTFPTTNVVHVIDTCKYRPKLVESCGSSMVGTYRWVSQVDIIRRSRCAGRITGVGSYYSLMSLQRFTHLPSDPIPASNRYLLPYVALRSKQLLPSLSVEEVLGDIFHPIQKKSKTAIEETVNELKLIKALVPLEELNVLGRILASLAIPPNMGKMLIYGLVFRCLDPILVIASAYIAGSPIIISRASASNPYAEIAPESSSDQIAILEAYKGWWAIKSELNSRQRELDFCEKRDISYPTLVKMAQIKQILMSALLDSGCVNSMGRIFNRFIEGPESKDALMAFLNENSGKLKLVQCMSLIGLYPKFALSCSDNWNHVVWGNFSGRISAATCAGKGIDTKSQNMVCFAYNKATQGAQVPNLTEVSRASPLSLALFFTPDTRIRPLQSPPFNPPFRTLQVDNEVYFGFQSEDAGQVAATLKASLEICIKWTLTRLAYPTMTHDIKEYSEEEIVRYVDNVIRTTISLLESEKY